jgi:hypothetical protein
VHFWNKFLTALQEHTPVRAVNIEHEDASFGAVEGLSFAAGNLMAARTLAGLSSD